MDMKWACCLLVVWCLVNTSSVLVQGHLVVEEDAQVGLGLVKMQDRKQIVSTEYGSISTVDVDLGARHGYHLQFISLDPNSLFLPAILHADMVFYVHTGGGRLSYIKVDDGDKKEVELSRGDVYRLQSGIIFFLQSNLEPHRERFRINALFSNVNVDEELQGNGVGAYSRVHELFQGFDKRLLQAAFQVPEEVIEEMINASHSTPPIVHAEKRELETTSFVKNFLGIFNSKKKKKMKGTTKAYNILKEDKDVENSEGWSTMVTSKHLHALKGSDIGVFMGNLTRSAMMGPHWNPISSEIGVVLEGRGMVQVVCSSNLTRPECNNTRLLVEEGDVFIVPRFHPMAQMSFNNETLVFMGFSTSNTNNHPQFLAGEASVLRALNKEVLKLALHVNNTAISRLLAARKGSIILDCVSCAEAEQEIWLREKEERKRKKEEEEIRRRQEEEEQRRREEEEETRRRREEEEEREERRREEEKRRKEEEEERQRQEEETRRRQEEEEQQRRREEEEQRKREEEEEMRRAEEKRRKEEEERRQKEEEQARWEEEERERQQAEEEAQRRQEEEEKKRREEEEEQPRRRQEEERKMRRVEEEEKEERRREEEKRRKEEDERWREEEDERRWREEKERREKQRRQDEEEARRQQERAETESRRGRRHQEGGHEETEEEAARREEEERERQWEQEEGYQGERS